MQNVDSKLTMYLVHKLLSKAKEDGMKDMEIWKEIKEFFESTDYNLEMELRPLETIWGDTGEIDKLLEQRAKVNG